MTVRKFFKGLSYMFSQFSLKTKIVWIILVLLFGLYIVNNIFNTFYKNHKNAAEKILSNKYSAAERLNFAKKYLMDGYKPNKDPMKTQWGNVAGARINLERIRPEDKEYPDAQLLLKEVQFREDEIRKIAEKNSVDAYTSNITDEQIYREFEVCMNSSQGLIGNDKLEARRIAANCMAKLQKYGDKRARKAFNIYFNLD